MLPRIILMITLLQFAGSALAKPTKIDLAEALRLAQQYVVDHRIPIGNRFLASIAWHEEWQQPDKSCWIVAWEPSAAVTDGQLIVWIYEDGRIRFQDHWA